MTTRRIKRWILMAVLAFLTACQHTSLPDTRTAPSFQTSTATFIEKSSSPTFTAYPAKDKTQQFTPQSSQADKELLTTPSPSFTTRIKLLDELTDSDVGTIWVYLSRQSEYLVIDLEQGSSFYVKAPPKECNHIPIINTLQVICISNNEVYLYDLLTGESVATPITGARYVWDNFSSGEYLLYEVTIDADTRTIYSYNLTSQTIKKLGTFPFGSFEVSPFLSADGKHLATHKDNRIFEIDTDTDKPVPISPEKLRATENYHWSPTAAQLVFGATDLEFEIGIQANYVYLYDMEKNDLRLLSTPPPKHRTYNEYSGEYSWPIWSPDGKEVMAVSGNAICIVVIETGDETCGYKDVASDTTNYRIEWVIWSPGGNHIAFLEYPYGQLGNLIVYSAETGKFTTLIEGEYMEELFWRQPMHNELNP